MSDQNYVITKWWAMITTGMAGMWLHVPHVIQVLLVLMCLDFVSGVIAALANGRANSSVMVRGLFKKLAVFPLLALLHIVEQPLSLPFELESFAGIAFIMWEAMSIVENCANAGAPIPSAIVNALAKATVKIASPEEIHRQFGDSEQSRMSVRKSTDIIHTPAGEPDLKVDETITILEEKHIEPIDSNQ